jgi:DNA gyrase subunit B
VRQYNLANAIMMRLTRVIDRAALTAIMTGVTLDLTTRKRRAVSAQAMEAAIKDPP